MSSGEHGSPGDRSLRHLSENHCRLVAGRQSPSLRSSASRLLERGTVHAGLIMTPGLIGKRRESPPIWKPKPRVSPRGSAIAVPRPRFAIALPSAAIGMRLTISDRLHGSDTTLIHFVNVRSHARQSPRWLGQGRADRSKCRNEKAQLVGSHHVSSPRFAHPDVEIRCRQRPRTGLTPSPSQHPNMKAANKNN
jgi:hypothetical protein